MRLGRGWSTCRAERALKWPDATQAVLAAQLLRVLVGGGLACWVLRAACGCSWRWRRPTWAKGFEGLHALVGERLREEVRSGALFVFTNKRHTRLKVLYFDGSGLWFMTKRLEQGTFAWPKVEEIGAPKLALRPEAFAMLTDGIDLRGAKMRPWFERE